MAINFPNAPTIGQKYTAEGQTWVWNGTMWLIDSAAAGSAVIASPTPPADPLAGQLWYRTTNPVGMFMWLNDGNSTQWVQTNGGGNTAPPLVASTAEARAGTDNVKMMTPAAVQARTGVVVSPSLVGLSDLNVAVPPDASEITVSIGGINLTTATLCKLYIYLGGGNAYSGILQSKAAGNTFVDAQPDALGAFSMCYMNNATYPTGVFRATRFNKKDFLGASSLLRVSATEFAHAVGNIHLTNDWAGGVVLGLYGGGIFAAGNFTVQWRI